MATTKAGIKVFRPTITADQMIGTVEALQHYRSVYGLNKDAVDLLVKFEKELVGIQYGTDKSAYVTKGRAESKINLNALGASPEEVARYNNSPDMDQATNDQLTWMINHPEVSSSDMPALEEFTPGGKYYEGSRCTDAGGGNNTGSNTNRNDDLGTDCFLALDDNKKQDQELGALFNQL